MSRPKASAAPAPEPAVKIPGGAATWSCFKEVDGAPHRCRWYANGVAVDRWPVEVVPSIELLSAHWGRGRYQFSWQSAAGAGKGRSVWVRIDDPQLADLDPYPNKPKEEPAPAPARRPAGPGGDEFAALRSVVGNPQASPMDMFLACWSITSQEAVARAERAERLARAEIEAERERSRLRIAEEEQRAKARVAETAAYWQAMARASRERDDDDERDEQLEEIRKSLAELGERRDDGHDRDDDSSPTERAILGLVTKAGPQVLTRMVGLLEAAAAASSNGRAKTSE